MKITVKYYLNCYLKAIEYEENGTKTDYYPLYLIITLDRKNTQIRSLTDAYLTKKGLAQYNASGTISQEDVFTEEENFGEVLKEEQKDIYNIVQTYKNLYGDDAKLKFVQTNFSQIYKSIQLKAKAFISPYVWEYAKKFVKDESILEYINTHRTFPEIAKVLPIADISAKPDFFEMWEFVEKYVPGDIKILDWYLNGYGKVVNKNEIFDEILCNALFELYPKLSAHKDKNGDLAQEN